MLWKSAWHRTLPLRGSKMTGTFPGGTLSDPWLQNACISVPACVICSASSRCPANETHRCSALLTSNLFPCHCRQQQLAAAAATAACAALFPVRHSPDRTRGSLRCPCPRMPPPLTPQANRQRTDPDNKKPPPRPRTPPPPPSTSAASPRTPSPSRPGPSTSRPSLSGSSQWTSSGASATCRTGR